MTEVRWGNLGMRDQYIDWLARKVVAGWATALAFIIGAGFLILKAFDGSFTAFMGIALLLWLIIVGVLTGILSYINSRIRNIENFLGFYENRYEVRHKLFCNNHLHCVSLHYFKSIRDD